MEIVHAAAHVVCSLLHVPMVMFGSPEPVLAGGRVACVGHAGDAAAAVVQTLASAARTPQAVQLGLGADA